MKSAEFLPITPGQMPIRDAESPGVRLMNFLSSQQAKILAREKDNERMIHLYGLGGYWVAFDRSAYQLCRLFPQSETSIIRFTSYPFPVVMATVADVGLHAYSRQHIFKRDEADYKELVASEISARQYQLWHRNEVQECV